MAPLKLQNVGFLYGEFSKTQSRNFIQSFLFILRQAVYVLESAELKVWIAICFPPFGSIFNDYDPDEHFVF
jgi:hypothetical protein